MGNESHPYEVIAILAEDVRTELGGKHTIIGAFAADILMPYFPASFKIAGYLVFKFMDESDHVVKLELMLDGISMGNSIANVDTRQARSVVLVIPTGIVTVDRPQTFSVMGTIDEGERRTLVSTAINLAPSEASISVS